MHLQHLAPDQLVQQVALFARTRTTTCASRSISSSAEEPLLGERGGAGEEGLCVGHDVSLLEVVGVVLITCEEVGVVKRVHTIFGGVHRLATALKVVEESAGGSAGDKG